MYNHNKAQQSKNRVHISWDILYMREQSVSSTLSTPTVYFSDSKVQVAKMGSTWVLSAPGGPNVDPFNLGIRDL